MNFSPADTFIGGFLRLSLRKRKQVPTNPHAPDEGNKTDRTTVRHQLANPQLPSEGSDTRDDMLWGIRRSKPRTLTTDRRSSGLHSTGGV